MRYVIGPLAIACLMAVASLGGQQREDDAAYLAAYQRWRTVVESQPNLSVPSAWYSDEHGPSDLRDAVRQLVSYGPNTVPVLVAELRRETDHLRLYRLIALLKLVAGIDVFFEHGSDWWDKVPEIKRRFLADWDAGRYEHATAILRSSWAEPARAPDGRVDPQSLVPVLRFGVFAIPFIAERVATHNSDALFAAFLNVTGQMDLYQSFYAKPSKSFQTGPEKAAFMREWARQNAHKFGKLKALQEQVAAVAK